MALLLMECGPGWTAARGHRCLANDKVAAAVPPRPPRERGSPGAHPGVRALEPWPQDWERRARSVRRRAGETAARREGAAARCPEPGGELPLRLVLRGGAGRGRAPS